MIRRDYILRMIEKIVQVLMGIREKMSEHNEVEAEQMLDQVFRELVGLGPLEVSRLSEMELLALLMKDDPTQVLREKSLLLVALLEEAARLRAAQGHTAESQACRIKALDLLLSIQLQDVDLELPAFVPRIGAMHDELSEAGLQLPLRTLAALWRHYERTGAYARAEDVLFTLLEDEPDNPALRSEARAFYERLLRQSDASLEAGNLPRKEVEAGLAELVTRAPTG
jgi:Family of unknown function (DUF6483)